MAYVTLQDLLLRFPAQSLAEAASDNPDVSGDTLSRYLADPAGYAGSDELAASLASARGLLQASLDDASAEADSYLASRYDTPLAEPPAALKSYCIDIAMYRLFERRDPEPDADTPRRVRYDAAITWLLQVATGELSLRRETDEPAAQDTVLFDDAPPTISEQTLAGF